MSKVVVPHISRFMGMTCWLDLIRSCGSVRCKTHLCFVKPVQAVGQLGGITFFRKKKYIYAEKEQKILSRSPR